MFPTVWCCVEPYTNLVIVRTITSLEGRTTSCGLQMHTAQNLKSPSMQVWVSIAAKLNYDIVQLNKDDEKRT